MFTINLILHLSIEDHLLYSVFAKGKGRFFICMYSAQDKFETFLLNNFVDYV